ncbi:MAG: heat-inducible transcriptional repressor HrcA [Actinobacteria bacterium]|nr:heat-inducible transcriptional repressor HrcA [Actinomycetota bacterium]NBY15985.1 heat-inducible transcriptional repressor HrcA [Actinomycetota bacterium]
MEDRKLAVLRAIVEDYVQTNEPVGSKVLVDRHALGVSSATIRNDMAALEDEGYLSAPHTSAGRIPTDKGYRLFVDRLSTLKPLSSAERRAIESFLDASVDLDDVMGRTVRLLAQLTKQVALVQYPTLGRSSVRHIELIATSSSRLLLVVIADTGRIEQRSFEIPASVTEQTLTDIRLGLNAVLVGKLFSEVPDLLNGFVDRFEQTVRPIITCVLATLLESVVAKPDERVMISGTANLARGTLDFGGGPASVLEALEEQVILLKLFETASSIENLTVHIGHENPVQELRSASVVSAGYGKGDQVVAHLGVVGPTRMDYPASMAAVHAVAGYVGQILKEQTGG